jgi:hypothetical protein
MLIEGFMSKKQNEMKMYKENTQYTYNAFSLLLALLIIKPGLTITKRDQCRLSFTGMKRSFFSKQFIFFF